VEVPEIYSDAVRALHRCHGSWTKVEALLGVNRGILWRVAKGKKNPSPAVICAVDSYLRMERSSDPDFLRFVKAEVVPWLRERSEK